MSCVLRKLRIHIESPSGHILKLRPVQSSSPRPAARTPRRTEPYLVAESLSLCTTLFNVISISASSHPKKPILHTTLIPPQPREILSSLKLVFIFIRVHMSYHCSALALGLWSNFCDNQNITHIHAYKQLSIKPLQMNQVHNDDDDNDGGGDGESEENKFQTKLNLRVWTFPLHSLHEQQKKVVKLMRFPNHHFYFSCLFVSKFVSTKFINIGSNELLFEHYESTSNIWNRQLEWPKCGSVETAIF